MMLRDYDCIPKWCLPDKLKKSPSVDVNLDDSMPETPDSTNWSVRCENHDRSHEIGLSAAQSEKPRCHEREAYGQLANNSENLSQPLPDIIKQNSNAEYKNKGGEIRFQRLLEANRQCKHCSSNQHWSKDCEFLKDMVLNKGIYTLRRTRDPDEPSSSHSRSSLSEISLTFFDNQPPIGENNLSYVKRRWELIEESAKEQAERDRLKRKPPENMPSFRANSRTVCRARVSRLPAKETRIVRAPAS